MFNVIEIGIKVYGATTMGSFLTYKEAEDYIESLIEGDRLYGCEGEYEYSIIGPYNQ